MSNHYLGQEVANVQASAKITKANGTEHKVEADEVQEQISFEPYGCLCGNLWLMIEDNTPNYCPSCGEAVVVEGG